MRRRAGARAGTGGLLNERMEWTGCIVLLLLFLSSLHTSTGGLGWNVTFRKALHIVMIYPVERFLMWVTARLRFQLRGCCESRMGPSLGALIGCTSCRRTSLDLPSDHEEDLGAGHAVGQNIRHAPPPPTLRWSSECCCLRRG